MGMNRELLNIRKVAMGGGGERIHERNACSIVEIPSRACKCGHGPTLTWSSLSPRLKRGEGRPSACGEGFKGNAWGDLLLSARGPYPEGKISFFVPRLRYDSAKENCQSTKWRQKTSPKYSQKYSRREYSQTVGIKLGSTKYEVTYILRGKLQENYEDMVLMDGSIIKCLGEGESYKYLVIPNSVAIKKILHCKYAVQLQKIWESHLPSRNILNSKILAWSMQKSVILESLSILRVHNAGQYLVLVRSATYR